MRDAEGIAAVINSVVAEGGLTSFDKELTAEEERRFIASLSDKETIFIAQVDGEVVGVQSVALFSVVASMSHVATIGTWICKGFRGRGIGKLLAKHSLEFARKKGFKKIFTWIMANNTQALAFYKNLGFRRIGVAKRQTRIGNRYYDEVYVEKLLQTS